MTYEELLKKYKLKKMAKDEKWLATADLAGKEIVGNFSKVKSAMEKVFADNDGQIPDYVEYRRSGNQTVLCLNIDEISRFCNETGMKRVDKTVVVGGEKNENWMNSHELADKKIFGGHAKIYANLEKMVADNGGQIPGYIEYRQSGSSYGLYLNIDKIDEFCTQTGLKRQDETIQPWSEHWLNAQDLAGKRIKGNTAKIYGIMKDYYDVHGETGVVKRLKRGSAITLYLPDDENSIGSFCEKMGLEQIYRKKDTNWLPVQDLAGKKIIGDAKKIRSLLGAEYEANGAENGEKNMGYIKKTTRGGLYLFCGKIEEFCKQTGLKQIDETIQKCDENWISVTALADEIINGDSKTVLHEMERLCGYDEFKDFIKYFRNGPNIKLYLHVDKIDDFCAATGVQRKDKSIPPYDENWISVTALAEQEISASRQEIANHIENFIANNGGKSVTGFIEIRRNRTGCATYLRADQIDLFCQKTGLSRKRRMKGIWYKNVIIGLQKGPYKR